MASLRRIVRGLVRPVERVVKGIVGLTGVKESNQTSQAAETYASEAATEKAALTVKTERERKRAQKLAIRGLRSKRSAGFYQSLGNPINPPGSQTIG